MFGPRSAYHSRLQRRALALSLALAGALGTMSAAGASYRIVDLGVNVSPTDISNQGTIVGSRRTDAGTIGFRLLTGKSLEDIDGTQSAQAVNEWNDVAGTTLTGAFLLSYDGTYIEWDGYSAYGMNESGQISGNRELPNPYRSRPLPLDPAIYTPSAWANPGIARVYPRGTRQGVYADGYVLLDINDGGLAVGRRWRSGLVGSSAVVTTAAFDGVIPLPIPNGGSANAVNGRNVIVGATGNGGGAVYAHAFRYDHATAEFLDLGTLHGGLSSSAWDVNESGQIVGTSWLETEPTSVSDPTRYHAFIWEGGVMRDLNDLVDAGWDWTLTSASAVNDNGDIVGVGIRGRQQHGFLLTGGDAAPLPESQPPVAVASADETSGKVPLTVHFSASGSHDPDGGDIRMVSWDFGDGSGASTLNEPLHEFVEPGTYVVVLTVTDDEGTTNRAQIEIDARHSNGRGRIRRNGP